MNHYQIVRIKLNMCFIYQQSINLLLKKLLVSDENFKGIKVCLNRSIYAVEISFFKFQAPRFRKELIDVAKFHQKQR